MKINIHKKRQEITAHLKELGVMEKIDENQIEIYLLNLKSYWDYEEYFKTHDRTIVTHSAAGVIRYAQKVPEVDFQNANWNIIQKLSTEFGLTPKSRAAIKAEKNKSEEDEFEILRKGLVF